jgi:hypothetical protein
VRDRRVASDPTEPGAGAMQVNQAMSDDVRIANPNQTIREAAALMA